jgi:hypothetical protein
LNKRRPACARHWWSRKEALASRYPSQHPQLINRPPHLGHCSMSQRAHETDLAQPSSHGRGDPPPVPPQSRRELAAAGRAASAYAPAARLPCVAANRSIPAGYSVCSSVTMTISVLVKRFVRQVAVCPTSAAFEKPLRASPPTLESGSRGSACCVLAQLPRT